MSDAVVVRTTTGLVHSGPCQLVGMIITSTATTGGQAILDDSTLGGGTQLLSVKAGAYAPVIALLREQFFVSFSTGMYLTMGANMVATLWVRQL